MSNIRDTFDGITKAEQGGGVKEPHTHIGAVSKPNIP
jgi:hypothetical protein